jgi:uncharacterized membrane protein YjgN (DUF898 family)
MYTATNSTALDQPPPQQLAPQSYRIDFRGDGGEFFLLLLKNVLLTIVTLGIYRAWAKTERRRFIWRNLELHGHRFGFTGKGEELFIAYLKVAGLYIGLVAAVAIASAISPSAQLLVQIAVFGGVVVLVPYAIYWSRAYLLSRTTFRGIRFALAGKPDEFVRAFLLGNFLSVVTLGLYTPYWRNNTRRILINNTRFGGEPFNYGGLNNEVFWISLRGVLLSVVTLGIYAFWMQAELLRYTFAHTTFSGARGKCTVTGGMLLQLFLLNVFGNTLTLGIAFPWISVYTARSFLRRVSFEGHIDFDAITQTASLAVASGDALADALDVGLGV